MESHTASTLASSFFLSFNITEFMADLEDVTINPNNHIAPVAVAFRHNLESVIEVVSLPITLASSTAQQEYFNRVLSAERIRRIPILETPDAEPVNLSHELELEAFEAAKKQLTKTSSSREGIRKLGNYAFDFLYSALQSDSVKMAAAELMRQGVVLTWGTLEVLTRDVFVSILNLRPALAIDLMRDEVTRRKFEMKSIPLERLAERQFDISNTMGELLSVNHNLGDLPSIKDVYRVLFPGAKMLFESLSTKELWRLNQQRHLIVHRRGIIDQSYRERTGDTSELGTHLVVQPDELKIYLRQVRDAGRIILSKAVQLAK